MACGWKQCAYETALSDICLASGKTRSEVQQMVREARAACSLPDEPHVVAQQMAAEAMRDRLMGDDALLLELHKWAVCMAAAGLAMRLSDGMMAALSARCDEARAQQAESALGKE